MDGFLKWISGWDADHEKEIVELEPAVLLNRIGFFAFSITFTYVIFLFIFGFHLVGRSQIPFVALYSLVPLCTYSGKLHLGKSLIAVSIFCQVILLAYLFAHS
jgi:hypothetical protein